MEYVQCAQGDGDEAIWGCIPMRCGADSADGYNICTDQPSGHPATTILVTGFGISLFTLLPTGIPTHLLSIKPLPTLIISDVYYSPYTIHLAISPPTPSGTPISIPSSTPSSTPSNTPSSIVTSDNIKPASDVHSNTTSTTTTNPFGPTASPLSTSGPSLTSSAPVQTHPNSIPVHAPVSHPGMRTGTTAGIAVGAVSLAIACAVLFVWIRRRRRRPTRLVGGATPDLETATEEIRPLSLPFPLQPNRRTQSLATLVIESLSDNDGSLVPQAVSGLGVLVPLEPSTSMAPIMSEKHANSTHRIAGPVQDPAETDSGASSNRANTHTEGMRRHETDGGVRLAGGRAGDVLDNDPDGRRDSVGSTLPPPYSDFL
ncbi:hypothetical protein DICSQDRAFT_149192 [Dichomitus squalens LYAD-421 SS1]|uniref:Uncharacterized protein n=1 Tax=Dichomitus squalens (strain LYAD-421) TaxID=732165 RepID=R7STH8_DICSQ|nr:uncharacterized protein DICSQDRAFT_149192 [Dichomitus squalens LYAD-421 SS1]EJF58272.1 hypothetical protein DICSQDRAFT_149192 [Dichomitus squalens LYAD-421 SS1]